MSSVLEKTKTVGLNFLTKLKEVVTPNQVVSKRTMAIIIAVEVLITLYFWNNNSYEVLPRPLEIWESFKVLMTEGGLAQEMMTSLKLCLNAILHTVIISLVICYATVIPIFRPIAFFVSKNRFLTVVGLSFVFTILTQDGYSLKISLLTFGMTVFFVTEMMTMLNKVLYTEEGRNKLNHARTLGMSEWRVVWEVIVLGKIDQVFDIIRNNFAIAWMMLTLVEGLSRADGGVGTMLINQSKYLHLDAVFAIQFLILFVGVGLDYGFGMLKRIFCPYATISKT